MLNAEQIFVCVGAAMGAAIGAYAKISRALRVITGGKGELNLRELLTRRLDAHEKTIADHEARIESLESAAQGGE